MTVETFMYDRQEDIKTHPTCFGGWTYIQKHEVHYARLIHSQ